MTPAQFNAIVDLADRAGELDPVEVACLHHSLWLLQDYLAQAIHGRVPPDEPRMRRRHMMEQLGLTHIQYISVRKFLHPCGAARSESGKVGATYYRAHVLKLKARLKWGTPEAAVLGGQHIEDVPGESAATRYHRHYTRRKVAERRAAEAAAKGA